MKKFALVLLAIFSFASVAGAQEFPNEPYEFLLSKIAAERGDFDEALQHLDKVIDANPGDPVLLYERAMMYIDAGRLDRAESELRAVASKNPEFYDANRILGRLLLDRAGADRKQVEEALVFLQAAFNANPDDLSTGVAVSQILSSLGRTADAERVLATMVERSPDQRSLNYSYAQVLTKLGRGDESKQYLERAVTIDPTFGPAIMQLLDLYQQGNEWRKAAEVLQPLIAEDPLNLELQRQQAYFHLRAGNARAARDRFRDLVAADPKDVRALFYLGESLNDLESYGEAETIFRQLVAAEPDDADFTASLALSLVGQKKWEEASDTFSRLLTISGLPDNLAALARTQLANIDLQKGNYAAAVQTAQSIFIFRDRPNNQAVFIALEALEKEKKYSDALALLEPIRKQFPDDPFLTAKYIELLSLSGRKDQARAHANAQLQVGTRNVIASAETYVSLEDYASAIELLKTAIAARPEEVDLRFELGSVHERAGDRKAAETLFQEVLETHPDHAPSLNYLGYMWAESGVNLDRAHEMLTRAVGQEPNNGAYVDSLGWVYFQLGKLDLAEKYLTDAARLLPRDATVHEHLGDVFAKRGDVEGALKAYRTALDLEPQSKDVQKLRSKIAEIERHGTSAQR